MPLVCWPINPVLGNLALPGLSLISTVSLFATMTEAIPA